MQGCRVNGKWYILKSEKFFFVSPTLKGGKNFSLEVD